MYPDENNGVLIISCTMETRKAVEDLINSAIGEYLVNNGLYYEWSMDDLQFIVYCKDKKEKYNLVHYIHTWLNDKDRKLVKYYNGPITKDGAQNKKVLDYILEDFKK